MSDERKKKLDSYAAEKRYETVRTKARKETEQKFQELFRCLSRLIRSDGVDAALEAVYTEMEARHISR